MMGRNLGFSFPEAGVQMSFLSSGTFREMEGLGEMSHRHRSFHRLLKTHFLLFLSIQ